MILRTIAVTNWRCHLNTVSVGPFREGLNVIHAPNATGKSTLFEALRRGIMDGHKVAGRDAEALRPWGRSLAPTVMVEFSHAGMDYRITKRFLDSPTSKFERRENGQFVPLSEGGNADEAVRAILSKNAPGRGLSRPENWGLAQVLWAPQGKLGIERLSGDVLDDIRSSLGTVLNGTGTDSIEKSINDLYLGIFTAGGKEKTGKEAPAIARLREQLNSTLEKRNAAVAQLQRFDEGSRRVTDLRAQREQSKRNAEAFAKTLKEMQGQVEGYRTALAERNLIEQRLKVAEAQHSELKGRIDQIKGARREFQKASESLKQLEGTLPLQNREVELRQGEVMRAKAALEDARKERLAVDEAQQLADEAVQFAQISAILRELSERLQKIEAFQHCLADLRRKRSDLVAPDASALKAVRRAIKTRDEAQVRIESALITLEIVPEKDSTMVILEGEQPGSQNLTAGKPIQAKGSPEVVIELPGMARVRAWGAPGSIEEHRRARATAERTLQNLTQPYGTIDLDRLEKLHEKASEMENEAAGIEAQVEALLGEESLENIEQERPRLEAILTAIIEKRPEWKANPPEKETMRSKAKEISRAFVQRVEDAEGVLDTANAAMTAAMTQQTKTSTQASSAVSQIEVIQSRLDKLTNDGKTDEQRADALKKSLLAWDGARMSLDQAELKLSAYGDDPSAAARKLEQQREAADHAASKAMEAEKIEEGRLESMAAEGPYSTLALLEEQEEYLTRQVASERLRVDAIRLMHDVVEQCRREALSAVAGPVEAAATRILRRIAGDRLGDLKLGDTFQPSHIVPVISRAPVGIENLSGGEAEQIHLATRLALAEVLARDERQMVVFDDVLIATDTSRLARIMTILEEAAQRLQLIILTCHPERYGGLEGANFVDLQSQRQF